MKKLLIWLFLPPLAIVMVAFAIANRHGVVASFDPLPFSVEVPLYTIVFAVMLLGLLAGGFFAWVGQAKWRKQARRRRRENDVLTREIDDLRAKTANDSSALAATPSKAVTTRA